MSTRATISMRMALDDPSLLGGVLDGDSWQLWRALLIAANGEALTDEERALFAKVTGRASEPLEPIEELWAVVGRRGGKSRAAAVLAIYHAALVDHSDVVVVGERPVALCLAQNQKQAGVVFAYIVGIVEARPLLAALVVGKTAESLDLIGGITIEVRAASFRGIRGVTAIVVIADEAAFWYSEESGSVNAAEAIFDAVLPALATTGGPLIVITSPYSKQGAVFETYSKHFGEQGDPLILVAQGASRDFNPSLKQRVVDRAYEKDPVSASAEYGGLFRDDVGSYLAFATIDAAVDHGVSVRPPRPGISYAGYADAASGTGQDSFAGAIAHAGDDGEAILDLIFEVRPPFNPQSAITEFSNILKTYGIYDIKGDKYAAGFVIEAFNSNGITYEYCDRDTSANYIECVALFTTGRVRLVDNKRLTGQFAALERRTSVTGRDRVNHPGGQHDDCAAASAGVLAMVAGDESDEGHWRALARSSERDDQIAAPLQEPVTPPAPVAPPEPYRLNPGEIFIPPKRDWTQPAPEVTSGWGDCPPARPPTGEEFLAEMALFGRMNR